ncbi:MAG: choice-of-anchor B family protein [Bacteroidetes bacterium]|nr:choice-of-anchor B family protein [Bacteroidota bacterium]
MNKIFPDSLKTSLIVCLTFVSTSLFSQKQLELVSHLDYVSLANDIWGYTAPDGTEYALVGLRSGVSIVSLADPANPAELQFIPGGQSAWRDLKTWGHFAYVTTDQPGTKEGLLVIDLGGLPGNVTWANWQPVLPGQTDSLFTCHNLWIDENGFCYLSGCDQNSGGVIMVDVFSQPGLPQFVSYNAPVYAHDCYALNNLLYTAEIYEGQFSVFDVTDKQNPVLLATQPTPFQFCHNVWATADGKTLFTTDERANAPTAAFDISDLGNIRLLDEFRPLATLNTSVIPHNAHVLGNHVVISNYTDGCVIVDATRPDNLIEVESYDTNTDFTDGFHGCWGAYPFFPSGLIAATDIENGLFIFNPTYPRASYLEGNVTDASSGTPIADAGVEIQSADANFAVSSFAGKYKTGQASEGTFDVLFRAKGYFDLTTQATLSEGEVTILDVEMVPLPQITVKSKVLDFETFLPLANVQVLIENDEFSYSDTTNSEGVFEVAGVLQGNYTLFAGIWGYLSDGGSPLEVKPDADVPTYLKQPGYSDGFDTDLGWQVDGTAGNGIWERGKPVGKRAANKQFAPEGAAPLNASSTKAYITGNEGVTIFDDQVDNGETRLTSPPMQLRSRYNRPMLSFDYWWYDAISNNPANDSLVVSISNGKTSVALAVFATDTANVQAWTPTDTFDLTDLLEITDNMRLSLTASDRAATPNVVEAGLDHFLITEGIPNERFSVKDDLVKMRIYPNPFDAEFTLDYKVEKNYTSLSVLVFNVLGQKIEEVKLSLPIGTVQFNLDVVPGMYFVSFRVDDELSEAVKVVQGF